MSEWKLWGRFGGSVQSGKALPPRLYFIPLTTSLECEGPLAESLGHRNVDDRSLEGVVRALDRAKSCESDAVVFPGIFLTLAYRNEAISRCQDRGLRIVHQVTTDTLSSKLAPQIFDELMKRLDAGDAMNLVFGAHSLPKDTLLARLTRWPDQVYFTFSARQHDSVIEILHSLQPYVRERLFFHFPFHLSYRDGHLSCREVQSLILKISTRVPGVQVRPMPGTELFDPRVDPHLDLEPIIEPSISMHSHSITDSKSQSSIEVSVIVPSYNNREYLLNTIKHLSRQNIPIDRFEIIVVDDGSNDGTEAAVNELVHSLSPVLNFKYFFSPRNTPRIMGDANYRAGISRNLGVKNATGRILCFLDSDILTPENFISDLIKKHSTYDVVQCKRLNLVQHRSDANLKYSDIEPVRDTFTTEDGYWEKFYAFKEWQSIPFFWKYTCTYGLSVSTDLFKRIGWIKRGFIFYGFEDVELGFRLANAGAKFHLSEMITYHLFHKDERSEFHNSDYLRQGLLAKTAQIFFLNTLRPDIYHHFRGLMNEQLPLFSLFSQSKYFSKISISPLMMQNDDTNIFRIPMLALRNWRWLLWRQWNRMINWFGIMSGQTWRLRIFGKKFVGDLARGATGGTGPFFVIGKLLKPFRKIYFFSMFQWKKRIRPLLSGNETDPL